MRVVVAMSGGVDSSTAAGLLVEQGHEVIGLAMRTHSSTPKGARACCTPDDLRDARRVADHLDIPFYVLDYEDVFRQEVVLPFARAYRDGFTPNPCVECNDKVKFRPLLERARALGAERLATGHYARLASQGPHTLLRRGADARKDQSYFLYRLDQQQLASLLFPVGDLCKDEVRAHAKRLGLPVAEKHESQEICFVGDDGYAAAVESILGEGGRPGAIVDGNGEVLGQHRGVHRFTHGQRKGLGIAAPEPLFVTGVDPERGEVQVGPRAALLTRAVELAEVRFVGEPPDADEVLLVQQRYRESPRPARLALLGERKARLDLVEPGVKGAPGQAAVLYRGDLVIGGGTVARSPSARASLPVVGDAP